jgi:cytochrome c-type biogenesis protein CcmF
MFYLDIAYAGERLLPGQIGHFCIVLSFVASLLATVGYYFATSRRDAEEFGTWLKIGRAGFLVHSLSIATVVAMLFYILVNKYYEYNYVWANTSDDLQWGYVFSAFWKDQEGSFLLWLFWHVVLGLVLLRTARRWEAPVLAGLSMVQAIIGSMILGIYAGGGDEPYKVGSNPFVLLRDVMDAPIFAKADYLTQITGNGLNPLLQNYWMTIHPPTLFLGFASTVVPFLFAVAGFWTRDYKDWLRPALPWALFSGAVLGLGILMGGAWAYEALTFGGYWAWDPVENMSLVPWLLLVGGIHANLVARATGHSVRAAYLFYALTFVAVLYSTFLTRSGILGDTSVHAFTEMGLEYQLVFFILTFTGVSIYFLLKNWKRVPIPTGEETLDSKEFWMFVGSLVLLLSSAMITASTSLPVFNKIWRLVDPDFSGRVISNPVDHYNRYQLWIAVFIATLTGMTQFLRFREMNWQLQKFKFFKKMLLSLAVAAVLTALVLWWIQSFSPQHAVLTLMAIFAAVANLSYLANVIRGNLRLAGSAFSHMGFGIMIVGILASGLMKHHISKNEMVMEALLDKEQIQKNIILYRGLPMFMSGYEVTYTSDTLIGHNRYYHVDFAKLNDNGEAVEHFTLKPNVLYDQNFTKVAAVNPSTKRYLHQDIYTHLASLPPQAISAEDAKAVEDSLKFEVFAGRIGDTITTGEHLAVIEGIDRQLAHPDYKPEPADVAVGVRVRFFAEKADTSWLVKPVIVLRGQVVHTFAAKVDELGLKVKLDEGVFRSIFVPDEEIDYQNLTFRKGQTLPFGKSQITFEGFDRNITHPAYRPEDGEVAVSAVLIVRQDTASYTVRPVYQIKGNMPFSLKDEVPQLGLHVRFESIDPQSESIKVSIGSVQQLDTEIPLAIAENMPRADWIVLEAIVFPGINLFWLGSLLMLAGLAVSVWRRVQQG